MSDLASRAAHGTPGVTRFSGRHVSLRHVRNDDYDFLYALETTGERGPRYRNRGITPGPDQFLQSLWQTVLVQFVVERCETGERVGVVVAYGADHRNGHARVAASFAPSFTLQGWPVEGWELFIDYLFQVFPLRKLYADILAFNLDQFGNGLLEYFQEEGRLRDHEYLDSRYWDLLILALYPDAWRSRNDDNLSLRIRGLGSPINKNPVPVGSGEFVDVFGDYFRLPPGTTNLEARLVEDLGLDSLQLYEVALLLEDASGDVVPDELMASLQTLGDVFHYYDLYVTRAASDAPR